jgi:hypothetical protein
VLAESAFDDVIRKSPAHWCGELHEMKQQTARSISFGRILWTACILAIVTVTGKPAQANTVNYVIHDNSDLYDTGAPAPLSVTGKFSFDTATTTISNFTLKLTGDSAIEGTYTDTSNPQLDDPSSSLPQIVVHGPAADGRIANIRLQLNGIGGFGPYAIVKGY